MRAVIIDDEAPARRLLREYIGAIDGLDLVAEFGGGDDMASQLYAMRPDIAFLDVCMPGLDGFELLKTLEKRHRWRPIVIFSTAHDRFALRAFEVRAADYLLKPFDLERFHAALQSALDLGAHRRSHECPWLLLRDGRGYAVVNVEEVLWIEAAGDYTRFHTDRGEFLGSSGIAGAERRLAGHEMLRIHRSAMIGLKRTERIAPNPGGGWSAQLDDGTLVKIGRSYLTNVKAIIV